MSRACQIFFNNYDDKTKEEQQECHDRYQAFVNDIVLISLKHNITLDDLKLCIPELFDSNPSYLAKAYKLAGIMPKIKIVEEEPSCSFHLPARL